MRGNGEEEGREGEMNDLWLVYSIAPELEHRRRCSGWDTAYYEIAFSAHGPRLPWRDNTAQVSVDQWSSPWHSHSNLFDVTVRHLQQKETQKSHEETWIMREPRYQAAGLSEGPDVPLPLWGVGIMDLLSVEPLGRCHWMLLTGAEDTHHALPWRRVPRAAAVAISAALLLQGNDRGHHGAALLLAAGPSALHQATRRWGANGETRCWSCSYFVLFQQAVSVWGGKGE